MSERLLISAGEVIEVQLTSETYVMAQGSGGGRKRRRKRGEAQPTGRIVNRMRVFVREADGKERTYDFEGARLGVHDGHSVCVVRGRCEGGGKPVNLMLCNLSTEDRDLFEQQIVTFLDRKRRFGPFWHGSVLARHRLVGGLMGFVFPDQLRDRPARPSGDHSRFLRAVFRLPRLSSLMGWYGTLGPRHRAPPL